MRPAVWRVIGVARVVYDGSMRLALLGEGRGCSRWMRMCARKTKKAGIPPASFASAVCLR